MFHFSLNPLSFDPRKEKIGYRPGRGCAKAGLAAGNFDSPSRQGFSVFNHWAVTVGRNRHRLG